jgi:SAM-dependent methyltransferase
MTCLPGSEQYGMGHCGVCSGSGGKIHVAREMMFGTHEEFKYFECATCGCLQLITVPADLGKYYGEGYYSFSSAEPSRSRYRALFRRLLTAGELFKIPGLRHIRRHRAGRSVHLESLACLRLDRGMKVLDVGCGSGQILYLLRELGFMAEGIDRYLGQDLVDEYGVRVRCVDLSEVQSQWDVIMFHHSLEHMPKHREVLGLVRKRLTPEGRCLIRIPVAHHAWRIYGVNWVQLDPPRHLVVHTSESFRRLAEQSGFAVERFYCDSDAFQFWASELYKRDIPLRQGGAHLFSDIELRGFETIARELNQKRMGDQAVFVLRPLPAAPGGES